MIDVGHDASKIRSLGRTHAIEIFKGFEQRPPVKTPGDFGARISQNVVVGISGFFASDSDSLLLDPAKWRRQWQQ